MIPTSAQNTQNNQNTLKLNERKGELPDIRGYAPHQQFSENSPEDILSLYEAWMFSLPHVRKVSARNSFPSARGAYIDESVPVNKYLPNREFTHIHYEPGPGSLHIFLPPDIIDYIEEKKWGVIHPMYENIRNAPCIPVMIYSPRNEEDLVELKKIVKYGYDFALSE